MRLPIVLSFSGHDPTGGAGVQADNEVCMAMGAHSVSVITCLTLQDTKNVYQVKPLDADFIVEQARLILDDMPVGAFKMGLLGSGKIVAALASLLDDYPDIPVVLDPILAAGGGTPLAKATFRDTLQRLLLPKVTIVTPNVPEAEVLSLLDSGYRAVLLTGTHDESTHDVINTLYLDGQIVSRLTWSRLPDVYHGSGCTLATAVAVGLAKQLPLVEAVAIAQQYTWDSLSRARKIGRGQFIPWRCA
ncbi:MAG: hydroxymethylpyrimidine/phosphomethylpyrimidine kinase [Cocleimonas sp.]|nr:hydroxymethylpyrimidine/phosphomethylpyrimidine kinase [Cocleimonas sp.]